MRPETKVDAIGSTLGRLAADQFCDQFGKLDEVFAVRNLALAAARRPALVRVEKEQVDIR